MTHNSATPTFTFATQTPLALNAAFDGGRLTSDGGLRDVDEVRALGFQYFCPGFTVSHGNPVIVDVGMEVEISGLVIKPGDLLHGDVNGLVAIPAEIADKVMAEVETVRQREGAFVAMVRGPEFKVEQLREYYMHH